MPDELRKMDIIFAEMIKEEKDRMKAFNVVSNALIERGLRETARQFNKLIQKI